MLIEAFQGWMLADPDPFSAKTIIYNLWEGLESVSDLAREESFLDKTRKGVTEDTGGRWGDRNYPKRRLGNPGCKQEWR